MYETVYIYLQAFMFITIYTLELLDTEQWSFTQKHEHGCILTHGRIIYSHNYSCRNKFTSFLCLLPSTCTQTHRHPSVAIFIQIHTYFHMWIKIYSHNQKHKHTYIECLHAFVYIQLLIYLYIN